MGGHSLKKHKTVEDNSLSESSSPDSSSPGSYLSPLPASNVASAGD